MTVEISPGLHQYILQSLCLSYPSQFSAVSTSESKPLLCFSLQIFSFRLYASNMISAKKLLSLARKWQNQVAIRRKRIGLPQINATADANRRSTSLKAEKGHFVVYSSDHKRFLLPLKYLNTDIIRELFDMAEEEFGSSNDRPLTLPCEAELMEYAIDLIKQQVNRDVERALLTSIANSCCSSSSVQLQHQTTIPQLPICSF